MSAAPTHRPLLARVLHLALVLFGFYVAACVAMFVLQDRFIWIPSRAILASPDQYGFEHTELALVAADGVKLHGWMIAAAPGSGGSPGTSQAGDSRPGGAPANKGAVLVCHGNAGNVSNCIGIAGAFRALGYAVLLFDYRGYGMSEGRPDERGTYLDAETAWAHLIEVEGFAPERVAIFGQSLGGGVASHLAREVRPGALIVENAFTSAPELGAELYRLLPVKLLIRARYPTLENLAASDVPKLVIHTPEDDIVPFAHGERLFASAREPKEMLVTGGGHNDGGFLQEARWREAVRAFLERSLGAA